MWFVKKLKKALHPPPFPLLFQVCPRHQGDPQSLCRLRPQLIMSLSQVGSLAQFFSDCLWRKKRIRVLNSLLWRTLLTSFQMANQEWLQLFIGCFQGVLGPLCQALHTWLCSCFSVAPITASQARLRALDRCCVSTKKPFKGLRDQDNEVLNWKEQENVFIFDC